MKRIIIVIFSVLVIVGISYYFYQDYRKDNGKINKDDIIYNTETQKWEMYEKEDPVAGDREKILENIGNDNGAYNKSVLKGYFESYNEEKQELIIKALIPFTQGGLFEEKELKLLSSQTIYCAPEIYIDPVSGKEFKTKDLVFPVKDGATLWMPTEITTTFQNFLEKSNEKTFVYLQLTNDYNKQEINYVKKLIAIGICE